MSPQASPAIEPVKTSAVTKPGDTQLFDKMEKLYSSIAQRAFEIFEGSGHWPGHELSDWLEAESEVLHPLHLEMAESDQALTVTAEVPGFAAAEINVQVAGNQLTISGKHESKEETKKGKTIYSERCAKEVFRSITLPSAVNEAKVSATLKDGLLSIELPKVSVAKSTPVDVKAS